MDHRQRDERHAGRCDCRARCKHDVMIRSYRSCRCANAPPVDEVAEGLDVSTATVEREWVLAKAWLYRQLSSPACPLHLNSPLPPAPTTPSLTPTSARAIIGVAG
jgi:hypothetical protein